MGPSPRTWPALDLRELTSTSTELVEAALVDFDVSAIQELSGAAWRVFFASAGARDMAAPALSSAFPALVVESVDVPDEDWAARSQASLTAVRVGRVIVAPPWAPEARGQRSPHADQPTTTDDILIVIQPSMGFGTGHHATTRLCLAALQKVTLRQRTVIDVGTGSGVLAIAASLLGAAQVIALDDDPDAIQAARENLDLNPRAQVALETTDVRAGAERSFDIAVANLTGGLLIAAAPRLQALLSPRGILVISGLMESEESDVLAAYAAYDVSGRSQEDEWLCLILEPRTR